MAKDMLYDLQGPDGKIYTLQAPEGANPHDLSASLDAHLTEQAAAQKAHEKKTGFISATKAGFHESLGAGEQALGEITGSKKLQDWAKENALKAQTEHEATTEADVENAKGMFSTAGKMLSKNITEPLGGILGSYGVPLVAGAVAAPIAAMVAPEAAVATGLGAGAEALLGEEALTALAGTAAKREATKRLIGAGVTTATAMPAEMGRNLQAQEQQAPGVAHNLVKAALASIPEAALVGFGMPGTKFVNRLVPELLPVAETLVPKIESGAMTAAEAQATLAGKVPQYLKAMAANTAAGTGMMVGTEDIRRAQAGQDLMSGAEMAQTAKTAGLLSPIFAAFHGSDRAAAHEVLTNAQRTRDVAEEQKQIGTHGGTEAEVADADAQRAADLAGLKKVNEFYNPIRLKFDEVKTKTENLIAPELANRLSSDIANHPDLKALDTIEGTKEFMAGLNDNKSYTEEEKKALKPQLQQYLKTFKEKDNAEAKLTPEQKQMAIAFDAHDDLRTVTGVNTSADLLKLPLADLHDMREAIQDPSAPKKSQPKIEYLTKTLDEAIANHPDTSAPSKAAQEAQFNQTLDAKRAKEVELAKQQGTAEQQRLAEEHAQRITNINDIHKQEVMDAFKAGPAAWRAFQEKQSIVRGDDPSKTKLADMPDEYFKTHPELSPEEAYAQIVRSTAKGRTTDKAELEKFKAGQDALEAQMKQEHQVAAVEDFGLQKQRTSDIAEPKEEPYVPAKNSEEGIGGINDIPGQANLFTPRTGKPTVEATTAARAAEEAFTVRDSEVGKGSDKSKRQGSEPPVGGAAEQRDTTTKETGTAGRGTPAPDVGVSGRNAGRNEAEITTEHATLKPIIEAVNKDVRDLNTLAEERRVTIPDTMGEELVELMNNHPTKESEISDWTAQTYAKIKEVRAHIRNEVNKRTEKGVYERAGAETTTPSRNETYGDTHGFGERGEESKKAPKEPKEVSTEPTTKAKLHEVVKDWFNPVWLNRALKNGWLHIEESIHDTDLPQSVKDKFDESKGLYFGKDGSIYLFAKNITQGHELGVILHEIGEHKGLDNMIGKDRVTQLANRVRDMANGKKGTLDQKIATKALARIEGMKGEKADKELIAYFTEIAVNEHDMKPNGKANLASKGTLDWINTLWNSISKALEKLHFSPKDFSAQDLVNVVHGAARLEMGRDGTLAGEEHIMESAKPQMTAAEIAARKARGLTVFAPNPKQGAIQSINTMYKTVGMLRNKLDTFGVQMVGPLFSAHRKANEYYGPDSFYTKTTNKIRGTLLMQHTLNAMNFIIPSMREGSLTIDAKGYFHQVIDKNNNIPALAKKYDAIQKAMKANGVSDAVIEQDIKTMVFADRYKALKDKGIKNLGEFSDESYKLGKDLQIKYAKEYKEWRDMYNNIRNNKRELLLRSSLMTSKKVDEFLDRLEYLPLYRMSENEAMDAVFMSSLTSATREQKLKYDTEAFAVGDPMENIMKNEMWLYQRAMRNHTANRMADEFSEMGLGRFVKSRQANDKNVVTILKDGELVHFQVDNPNDAAVFQAAPTAHGMTIGAMRLAASFVRRGVTITPSFAYRQMWDDVERTWMQSGGQRSFVGTLLKSASEQGKNLLTDSAHAKELEAHGVVGQVDIQDGFNRMMQHMMGTHNDTILGKMESVLEKAERVARNSDMAARLSVYDSVIEGAKKSGRYAIEPEIVQKEAALRAQMMINFNHKGTSGVVRTLTAMVPFINARIQSDWRLMDAIKGNIPGVSKEQAHKMLMFKVAKAATFTTLYAMVRSGEDDYEDSSEESRNRNFLFNIGGVPLKVPVAPEYALLKGATEHTYRMLTDQEFEDAAKMRHAISTGIGNLLVSPTDVMPSMIRPFLENITNHSFFNDRTLVSPTLLTRDVNKQYVEGQTSELAIYLSDVGQGMFGNEFNVSPIKIDNVLRGMFATMGTDIAFTSNLISNWASESERPAAKLNQIPEIGALFYDPNGSQRKNDFYTLRDKVVSAHNTLLSLKGKPEEAAKYREDNAALLRLDGQVNAITNQFAQIRKQKQSIQNKSLSEMDGDQKREALDALAAREKTLLGTRVQDMNKQLKEATE